MLKPDVQGTSVPLLSTEVAPGATRSYWRMRCNQGQRVETVNVAAENTLKIPPGGLTSSKENINSKTMLNVPNPSEIDYDTLTQELEYSQKFEEQPQSGEDFETYDWDSENIATLSGEQKAVLNIVMNGRKNIFFTGAAGTGKSVLLRCIISQLRRKYGRSAIGITALTGIAACNIGGQTLHRFAGVGLGKDSVDELVEKIKRNASSRSRWQNTQVLLIDEVSMLDVELLEKLEQIACKVRGNNIPFGGIQLICTGDLFQLPPVQKVKLERRFCFETPIWDRIIDKTVNLTQVFRQNDPEFVKMLNEMRLGRVSPTSEQLFTNLARVPKMPKGIVPTQLFSTRREVNHANQSALKRIVGTEYVYDCSDWKSDAPEAKYLDISRDVLAEERIQLKVGAQVMLIKNIDSTLVNGSIGRVVAFMSSKGNYVDYGVNEKGQTSHYRSRKVAKTESKEEESNQELVEKILGAYGDSKSSARKRKLAEQMTSTEAKTDSVLPVVKFVTPQKTVRFMMVHPETWEMHDYEGRVIASRTQLPLILAWALSIHKSQGQTLPYVCVDLKNIFEDGQAYVALSRATSLDGLQVHNFSRQKVRASSKVVVYYDQLEKIKSEEINEAEEFFKSCLDQETLQEKQEIAEVVSETDPEFIPSSSQSVEIERVRTIDVTPYKEDVLVSEPDDDTYERMSVAGYDSNTQGIHIKRPRIMVSSSPTA